MTIYIAPYKLRPCRYKGSHSQLNIRELTADKKLTKRIRPTESAQSPTLF